MSKNVLQPRLRTPANACKSSEQPLPLASEKGLSGSSVMWFEVPQSLMAFSLAIACDRHLAWRPTGDSRQHWPLHHVSALATSEFEFRLPVKLYSCY